MTTALRSLLILLSLMQASHADDPLPRSFGQNSPHELMFLSTWETGQTISVFFYVKSDKSGIIVWGRADDSSSPVVGTEIVQVLPGATPADCPERCVSLAQCQIWSCGVDWATADMPADNNQILFYMTNAAGGRYGATTSLSRTQ